MTPDALIQRLRALTGQRFSYLGSEWRLIEVLAAEDALVLASAAGDREVQHTQYGQPTRRVRQTLTLAITGTEPEGYSDEVIELLAGRITD